MDEVANAGSWESLKPPLSKSTMDALGSLGFSQMTPVQSGTVPLFMKNKDVVVEAVTGSGKTLAFVIPALEILLRRYRDGRPLLKNQIGALIISPTRELAKQIYDVLTTFIDVINASDEAFGVKEENGSNVGSGKLSHMLFIGGNSVQDDVQRFQKEGGQIVVGTPGRLDDLLKRSGIFNARELEVLILDEADRLLDMGFEQTLTAIINRLPKQRRTGLFSATMTDALNELVRAGLRNPVRVMVKVENIKGKEEQKIPSSLQIAYVICEADQKIAQLLHYLRRDRDKKFIIYFATCAGVDYFFKDPKSFAHRCGRTARLGREGKAVVFLTPKEDTYVEFLRIRKVPMMNQELFPDDAADGTVAGPRIESRAVLEALQKMNAKDRDMYEKSTKAFVSWVRSYNEHQASYIFRFKDVDIPSVARAFGLLKLPKMPELKTIKVDFQAPSINVNEIPYKDKAREKQRQAKLAKEAAQPDGKKSLYKKRRVAKDTVAWSQHKEAKEKRLERREKREKKRVAIVKAKAAGTFVTKVKAAETEAKNGKRSRSDSDGDDNGDWEEMKKELKAKKRKGSQKASPAAEFSDSDSD
ncbi:ATP-dependent RNA helicase ddx55 [Rhizophlyctis rosea]|nr:ATP-dependent RNA helicase ddx55 [Rhizophlyctis rosea]